MSLLEIKVNKLELQRLSLSCTLDILISSATVLSFIFQTAFLYGWIFILFKWSKQSKINTLLPNLASDTLCPCLPLLEIYIHGVAVTSIVAFIAVFFLYHTSLPPPAKEEAGNSTAESTNNPSEKKLHHVYNLSRACSEENTSPFNQKHA